MITKLLEGLRRRRGRTAPGVQVAYSPESDGGADPGEVVWTWVAYEDDPNQGKDRPVAVIGTSEGRLVAVALTSKPGNGDDDRPPVGTGSWDAERRPSYAKVERLLFIDPHAVRREGAALDRPRFDALVEQVRRRHPDQFVVNRGSVAS